MHLKSLELTGFKSFSEAKIEFPQGVTAVVGPNGTGKSNVVDAILWVFGEQSTKTLRSERMEDVIFNGTESRKPLGMAEVSLIVSGLETQQLVNFPSLEQQLGEYHEVMVTRRLYRNGDSEYLINKTPCRLKDIRSLFLDTRAGTKGHTVIEQGRIEQILNASPQDRRELIEETAGIVRYKKQKAETLRKLDSTHQNLLRVRDIIAEIRQRVTALDRQARQARNYRGLQDEARTIEIRLLVRDYRQLVATQAEVDSELAALELQESAQAAQQARLTSELQEIRFKLESHEQALAKFRDEVAHVERQQTQAVTVVEVERNRLGILEEQRGQAVQELTRLGLEQQRADAEIAGLRAKRAHAEAEIAERGRILAEQEATDRSLTARRGAALESVEQSRRDVLGITVQATSGENALTGLTHRVEEVARRIERLTKEQTELEVQKAGVLERIGEVTRRREDQERQLGEQRREREARQTASQQLEGRLRGAEQRASRQQEELASVESRLRALQGIVREEMGYGREGEEEATSVRAVCAGVREAVAEWLTMPPQFERAIEAALGERARAWLVEAPDQAREAIAFLTGKGLGRGAFVPLSPRWSAGLMGGGSQDWWSALAGQPGVLGKALDVIHAPEESRRALFPLFDGVVIVDTLHNAVNLWERGLWSAPGGPTLVTLEGEVLDAAGIMTGGTTGGPIQRRREIQELEEKKGGLVQAVQETRRECEQVAVQHGSAKADAQRLEGEIHAAEMRQLGLAKDQAGLQESVEGLERRVEIVRAERAADQEERVGVEREIESAQEQLNRFVREKADREAELVEASRALQATDEETLGIQHGLTESRMAVETLRARGEHHDADLSRLVKEQQDRVARESDLKQQISSLETAAQQSLAERNTNEALIGDLDQRAAQIRSRLVATQEVQAEHVQTSREIESGLAAIRDSIASSRESRTTLEVRRAEVKTHLATLEATLTGTYQLSVSAALVEEPDVEKADQGERADVDNAELRERLQKIRDRIQRMGAINLAAIEEYREQEERYRFLTTQEQDLVKSVQSLKDIISKINRTTKQMFMDTLGELQQKFGEVFTQFFAGGRAELVLVEPDEADGSETGSSEEPGVDIVAQPPGKRLKSITMLSGGEKTLTAIALIFASFLIRPTPFCVLDEIDAPLDEENIGRFTQVLRELAERAQFIVITHNKRTMAVADSLFGVTMEEPGVSKLVSVRLADLQPV